MHHQMTLLYLLHFWQVLILVVFEGQAVALPKERLEQNLDRHGKNARYYFSTDIEDEVGTLKSHRQELRSGTRVNGSYSYSDGFIRREVIYTADESGFKILRAKTIQLPHNTKTKSSP